MIKYIFYILIGTIILTGCQAPSYAAETQQKRSFSNHEKQVPENIIAEEVINNETDDKKDEKKENELTVVDDPNSTSLVVNKQRKLPDGYEPDDLVEADVSYYAAESDPKRLIRKVAADALESLFSEAKENGLELVAVSGYRSYDRQKQIYENSVETNGKDHADKFSATPGTSEHQTGLAMDVASAALVAVLEQSFIETDEGKWLEDHAHEHGFIIRYPNGKEDITGYSYEPWHLRYVGKDVANEIYEAQITLEEFFGFE